MIENWRRYPKQRESLVANTWLHRQALRYFDMHPYLNYRIQRVAVFKEQNTCYYSSEGQSHYTGPQYNTTGSHNTTLVLKESSLLQVSLIRSSKFAQREYSTEPQGCVIFNSPQIMTGKLREVPISVFRRNNIQISLIHA